jgi:hypothetical protein
MVKPRSTILTSALLVSMAVIYGPALLAQTPPTVMDVANAPIPIQVLVQGPADAEIDMQVICLFRSSPVNTMHGAGRIASNVGRDLSYGRRSDFDDLRARSTQEQSQSVPGPRRVGYGARLRRRLL